MVEVWVSGSVIVRGSGLLKDSCFRLASGEVRVLDFFSGCPHFCEKASECSFLFAADLLLYFRMLQRPDTSGVSLSEPWCPS